MYNVFSMCLQYFASLINQRKSALSYEVCFPSAIFLSLTLFIIDIIRTFNSIPTIKLNYIVQFLTTYSKGVLTNMVATSLCAYYHLKFSEFELSCAVSI